MSWGEYFRDFNVMLLTILPAYDKFRAPSVIIVVPTLLLCIMAALTLDRLVTLPSTGRTTAWKEYKKGLYLTGGVFALLLFFYISFDYAGMSDSNMLAHLTSFPVQMQEYIRGLIRAVREDRQGLFFDSLVRSFIYIAVAATVIGLWIKGRLKPGLSLGIVGALVVIDLLSIDTQYLNSDKYVDQEESDTPFQPTPADRKVMADKSYFRVFDLRNGPQNLTNDGPTPYFHHSITGYHPAKLSLYQDLIENQLSKYPDCQPVLNMLNTKYLLLPTAGGRADSAALNPSALGPVWFVRGLRYAPDPRAVMDGLTDLDTKDTALLLASDSAGIGKLAIHAATLSGDSLNDKNKLTDVAVQDSIYLIHNDNDQMTYHSTSSRARFAVFSEVYYDRGWYASIDGNAMPIIRTNFVLRGLTVPPGQHDIRFTFHPRSYYTGRTIQLIAGILLFALLAAAGVAERRAMVARKPAV